MFISPTDAELRNAGFSETHGIALWTHPDHPRILIDTNAEVVSVFRYPSARLVGSIIDALSPRQEKAVLRAVGLAPKECGFEKSA